MRRKSIILSRILIFCILLGAVRPVYAESADVEIETEADPSDAIPIPAPENADPESTGLESTVPESTEIVSTAPESKDPVSAAPESTDPSEEPATSTEMPAESPAEAPAETPAETPSETADETPESSAEPDPDEIHEIHVPEPETVTLELPPIAADNAALYDGYAAEAFGLTPAEDGLLLPLAQHTNLTGLNLKVYKLLKTEIAKTAAGTRPSTVYTFSLAALGVSSKKYSAKDLGLSTLSKNSYVTEQAMEALDKKSGYNGFDAGAVIAALQADCPYELYWASTRYSYDEPYIMPSFEGRDLRIGYEGELTFYLYVSSDYAAANLKVDSAHGTRVKNAVKNAKAVISANSAKSDIAKLDAYKCEICTLTSYDKNAAAGNRTYGDCWQLVYVFDKDPDTNVVCEGYAKAFQYLCDNSTFQNGKVKCITVIGTMAAPSQSGGHAWNVVTLDDGKNYLCDITNSDDRSVGSDGELFLASIRSSADGSVSKGYTFDCSGITVKYSYDARMRTIFKDAQLAIAIRDGQAAGPLGIDLETTSLTVAAGESISLNASVYPASTPGTITYTSSNDKLASVDADGIVTGHSMGRVTITAKTANGRTAACTVRVLFSDVINPNLAAYKAIYALADRHVVAGYGNYFDINGQCTRAQFVLFLWRYAGKPEPKSPELAFRDADEIRKLASDYAKAIAWGAEKHIVAGFTSGPKAGMFCPNDPCTRGQVVLFLWRYKGRPAANASISFADASEIGKMAPDYKKAIAWAVDKKITMGFSDNTFRPNANCTRGQCVTFLYRIQ